MVEYQLVGNTPRWGARGVCVPGVPGCLRARMEKRKRLPLAFAQAGAASHFVPQEGIEPPTGGLEGRCSIP